MKYKKLSLVVPAYNEERSLEAILDKVEQVDFGGIEKEIVIVNDASVDKTPEILEKYENKPGYKVLHNEENLGKSQTVRKGILASTGELVVIQDADLEYDPKNLASFVEAFQNTDVQLIYGNRFGKKNKIIYLQNWLGNTFLSFFSSLFTGLRGGMWTRDMEVCYKMAIGNVFRTIAKSIESKSNFGFEPEVTAKFSKYKINDKYLNFKQISIDYYPRSIEEGKKMNAIKDGIKAVKEILRFNLRN